MQPNPYMKHDVDNKAYQDKTYEVEDRVRGNKKTTGYHWENKYAANAYPG